MPVMPYNRKNRIMFFCSAGVSLVFAAAVPAQSGPQDAARGEVRAASVVRADARTGRLVRRVVVETPGAAGGAKAAGHAVLRELVDTAVNDAAGRYGIDPVLVHSVIRVESNYNPVAVSGKGAEGLMQLIPSTARRFGAVNSFDVHDNIEAGVKYLKYLLDQFGDDRLAVAAYNAGESAVQRYRNVPPYPETEEYVFRVGRAMSAARQEASAQPAGANREALAGPAVPRPVESFVDSEGRVCMRTR
jgi:soluble lytic murein transglycosylase-like protein